MPFNCIGDIRRAETGHSWLPANNRNFFNFSNRFLPLNRFSQPMFNYESRPSFYYPTESYNDFEGFQQYEQPHNNNSGNILGLLGLGALVGLLGYGIGKSGGIGNFFRNIFGKKQPQTNNKEITENQNKQPATNTRAENLPGATSRVLADATPPTTPQTTTKTETADTTKDPKATVTTTPTTTTTTAATTDTKATDEKDTDTETKNEVKTKKTHKKHVAKKEETPENKAAKFLNTKRYVAEADSTYVAKPKSYYAPIAQTKKHISADYLKKLLKEKQS